MIIGIVGLMASGKGTFADELVKKGFIKFTYSDVLREELKKRGVEITRKNLQDLGDEFRKDYGADYLTKKLIEEMDKNKNYVLEGIRNPAEINALRKFGNCFIIGIDAPIEKRFQIIIMRNKENDPHSIPEVKTNDDRERGKGEPEYGLQIDKCMKMIDFKILNDGDKEQLKRSIDKVINKIKKTK